MLCLMTSALPTSGAIPSLDLPLRLELARRYRGWTQRQLADSIEIGLATVQRYEQGVSAPKRATVIAWSFATGVDLNWLETGRCPQQGSNLRPADYQDGDSSVTWVAPVFELAAFRRAVSA